jgi:RNA polymerase sigma-70 factor (ECF subfamily)
MRGRVTSEAGYIAEVYAASYRRLVFQLYGVTGVLSEAEDLVQEAFVRALGAGSRFAGSDNPEAWLRVSALNLFRSRWRRLKTYRRLQPMIPTPQDAPGADAEHVVVMQALRSLADDLREVLALYYFADLSVGETAAVLGVPEGTVKSRLSRGRAAMKDVIGWDHEEVRRA